MNVLVPKSVDLPHDLYMNSQIIEQQHPQDACLTVFQE